MFTSKKKLSGIIVSLGLGLLSSSSALAFEWEILVHQSITRDALQSRSGLMNDWAIRSIINGNVNADTPKLPHKADSIIHFNSAKMFFNDSNFGSLRFDQSDAFIREQMDAAIAYARNNPKFMYPDYKDAKETSEALDAKINEVNRFARSVSDCGPIECRSVLPNMIGIKVDLDLILAPDVLTDRNDPHSSRGELFKNLSGKIYNLSRELEVLNANGSASLRADLSDLRFEVRAHVGRQHLGHAFHTIQDFFSHSNLVELLHDKVGPVCPEATFSEVLCSDSPISGKVVSRERLGSAPQKVQDFVTAFRAEASFNRANLRRALSTQDFEKLETGYVGEFDPVSWAVDGTEISFCKEGEAAEAGFNYCHWDSLDVPGLHKDNPDRHNHDHAVALATLISAIYWDNFLIELGALGDPPRLRLPDRTVPEGNAPRNWRKIAIPFTGPALFSGSLNYELIDITRPGLVSAVSSERCGSGVDYELQSGSSNFERDDNFTSLDVIVCGDRDFEATPKTFGIRLTDFVQLDEQQEGAVLTVVIQNDDIDRVEAARKFPEKELFKTPDLSPANPDPVIVNPRIPPGVSLPDRKFLDKLNPKLKPKPQIPSGPTLKNKAIIEKKPKPERGEK